jgi:uncharacterized protein (DUF305 family)
MAMRSIRVSTSPLLPLAVGVLVAGCAAASPPPSATPDGPTDMSAAEFEALYRARADSALVRFSEHDVRFVTGMIHHHAQALEMARLAETRAASPTVRTLAARIHNAQLDEIALMQRWLRDRGLPVPEVHEVDGRPMVHGAADGHVSARGMASPERMAQLGAARGPAFDRLFLELMIAHHRGAVAMVGELLGSETGVVDEAVFRLAADVQVDQMTEIRRMEGMLSALPAERPSP